MPKSEVFFVTDELQRAVDALPADQPRSSRLDPFCAIILRWRREGRTYRRIQQLLAEVCGVKVTVAMVFKFVKTRSRPRKPQPELTESSPEPALSGAVSTAPLKPRMSIEERRAQAEAIRASLAQSVLPVKPKDTRPLFDYDPEKPLTLITPKEN